MSVHAHTTRDIACVRALLQPGHGALPEACAPDNTCGSTLRHPVQPVQAAVKAWGIVREVRSLLDALKRQGFFISDELYQHVLRMAGEL
jgi:uncharacterized protein DUF3368